MTVPFRFLPIISRCPSSTYAHLTVLGPVTKNTTGTACGAPIRDRGPGLYATTAGLAALSGSAILGRLAFKYFLQKADLGADDWSLVATHVGGLPATITICQAAIPSGFGRDIWTLQFDQITNFLRYFFIIELDYFIVLALLKLSLLLFYMRIFPSKTFRRLMWATIAFDISFGLSFTIGVLLQCNPISYFWEVWDGQHQGVCFNINAFSFANAGISIALDVWMLALPLSQLPALKLHWKKKVGVGLMFVVGTL